jgi:hypothetical protein
MRLFDDTIQVVLQTPIAAGFECKCFSSVAAPNPALICVAPCGGPQAHTDARRLAHNLSRTLATLSTDVSAIPAPCGSSSAGPQRCQVHREPTCRRVLILVGDGTVELDDHATGHRAAIDHWVQEISAGNTNFAVVPALAESLLPRSFSLLGSLLRRYNACFWRSDPGELTPAALRAAGITVNDFRVFISYRRSDGQALADQLFDELNRRNFEVFLDRFRIDPGVHVQDRIVEELAHKSMVVLVETKDLPQSFWVAEELSYALVNRLGVLAVNVDGAPCWPGIGENRRMRVKTTSTPILSPRNVDRVCRRVAIVHGAALVRRRNYLRQTLRDSLLFHGARRQAIANDGFLDAYPKRGGTKPYRVWLTPRPADVLDFQTAKLKGQPSPVVVAPQRSLRACGRGPCVGWRIAPLSTTWTKATSRRWRPTSPEVHSDDSETGG